MKTNMLKYIYICEETIDIFCHFRVHCCNMSPPPSLSELRHGAPVSPVKAPPKGH